jgi:Zn-dependent protease with chaperone function
MADDDGSIELQVGHQGDLRHREVTVPTGLRRLAADVGIRRLQMAADGTAAAFTVGLARPRVVVTTALLAELKQTELAAVLRHEAEHARRRDPLRLLVSQVAHAWTYFLPLARHLRRQVALGAELAADQLPPPWSSSPSTFRRRARRSAPVRL